MFARLFFVSLVTILGFSGPLTAEPFEGNTFEKLTAYMDAQIEDHSQEKEEGNSLEAEKEKAGPKNYLAFEDIAQGFNDVVGPDANFDGHFQTPEAMPFTAKGILVVNKEYPLPEGYNPFPELADGPTRSLLPHVQEAYEQMQADAQAEGVYFEVISGYRSAAYQENLFWSYASRFGVERANSFSARGGQSEHQTGMVMDLATPGDSANLLQISFANTPAGQWLAAHSWEYGFILRYVQGKEAITGYQYEPWHFRYVGPDLAAEIGANPTITLEEHLGLAETDSEEVDPQGPASLYFRGKLYDRSEHLFRFPEDMAPIIDGNLPSGIGDQLYLSEAELHKAQNRRIPFSYREHGFLVPFADGWRLYLERGYEPTQTGDSETPEETPLAEEIYAEQTPQG